MLLFIFDIDIYEAASDGLWRLPSTSLLEAEIFKNTFQRSLLT